MKNGEDIAEFITKGVDVNIKDENGFTGNALLQKSC